MMKRKQWSTLLILLFMILALIGIYIYYGSQLNETLRAEAQESMNGLALEYKTLMQEYLEGQKQALWRVASMLNGFDHNKATVTEITGLLEEKVRIEPFDFFGVIYSDGKMYGCDGKIRTVENMDEINRAMESELSTARATVSYSGKSNMLYQICPIYQRGEVAAVLYGEFPADRLKNLQDDKNFSGNGEFALMQANGNYIFRPDWSTKGNFFEQLQGVEIENGITLDDLKKMTAANVTGKFTCVSQNKEYYCDYRPLPVDNWYLVSITDAELIQHRNHYFRKMGITFGIGTALVLLLGGGIYIFMQWHQMNVLRQKEDDLRVMSKNIRGGVFHFKLDETANLGYISEGFLSFIGYSDRELREKCDNCFYNLVYPTDREQIRHEVEKQDRDGGVDTYEYRLERSNGDIVWMFSQGVVVEKNKERWMYITALDITQNKNAQEELKVSEECFHLIMEKTDSIIFQWDIPNDRVSVTDVWEKKFGYELNTHAPLMDELLKDIIYEDDAQKNEKLFRAVSNGKHYGEELVRIRRADNTYIWCRVCLSGMSFHNQIPQRGVGVVIDIDKEKREMEEIQAMAERDSLSTLYNKGTTRSVISNFLSNEGRTHCHAFMMLDIDNFKRINDTLGHMYGDAAIADVAAILKGAFRLSDVLGRVGGDEFVVFVKDISSREMMVEKAGELCRLVRGCYAGQNKEIQLSVSVGVALFYEDGTSYDQLYRAADLALYSSKRAGKDRFTFYDKSMDVNESKLESAPIENEKNE